MNNEPGADQVEKILRAGEQGRTQLIMNEINLGEVFCRIAKNRGLDFAEEKISEILSLKIQWLLPNRPMIMSAARFKTRFPISYSDAFLAATCVATGGILLTGNPEFEKLGDEIRIQWLPKKHKRK